MKNIGIVCEGPTDFIILQAVIDAITGESNGFYLLQPEPDLTGQYGNGWKGVLKWCMDHAAIKKQLMDSIQPALDLLVIQMDGDVSRKDKPSHCGCDSTVCPHTGDYNPLSCNTTDCPITLPCINHSASVTGYMDHLKGLISSKLLDTDATCIVIPCDSLETWVVAAYDSPANTESIEDPWHNIIAKRKYYHDIRVRSTQKRASLFREFAPVVCQNWQQVTQLCQSARDFEQSIRAFVQ